VITHTLIALTEGEKRESLVYGIGIPEQWQVIHCGVDTTAEEGKPRTTGRQELHIPANAMVIGTVARLEPVKGVKYFIESVPHILSAVQDSTLPICFLVVGDGTQRDALEAAVRSQKMDGKVIFTGMRNDAVELMSLMDIYVQPSLNEGMGKTILQAQSVGLPVVATAVQGIPDVVKDGKTGILVPPSDARSMAEAICRLIRDPALRQDMGTAGHQWVNERVDGNLRFSPERMVALLKGLYEKPFR
jgi:glycosyltransferase involved in cell wall biosynthesis